MDFIKFKNRIDLLLSMPITIVFNFYYLPIKQAIRLPILLYRPTLWGLTGKIVIKSDNVRFGMIHFGRWYSVVLQRKGFWLKNEGTIIFRGNADFGAGTAIMVANNAILDIGDCVGCAVGLNIDCRYKITINGPTRFGWDVILMDSAMHLTKFTDGRYTGKGYKEIVIGKNNWITTKCIIQAGTRTPDYCIAATGSLLNKDYSNEEQYCLMAGSPAKVKKTGIWRDFNDCKIEYEVPNEEVL